MSDVADRLRSRAAQEGLALADPLSERLLGYFELLQRWNRKINLTSLLDPNEAIDRLLLEPIAAAKYLPVGAALADLGSGGGSPAIPLALAIGAPHLLMVESRSRKAAFLREAAREVQLHATVESSRFEEAVRNPSHEGQFQTVSVRAVRPDAATLAAAAALLRKGGLLALFQSVGSHESDLVVPPDLAWRGTRPLLRSTASQLALLFHVEHW